MPSCTTALQLYRANVYAARTRRGERRGVYAACFAESACVWLWLALGSSVSHCIVLLCVWSWAYAFGGVAGPAIGCWVGIDGRRNVALTVYLCIWDGTRGLRWRGRRVDLLTDEYQWGCMNREVVTLGDGRRVGACMGVGNGSLITRQAANEWRPRRRVEKTRRHNLSESRKQSPLRIGEPGDWASAARRRQVSASMGEWQQRQDGTALSACLNPVVGSLE